MGIIAEHSELWSIKSMLIYCFDFFSVFFYFLLGFSGFYSDFWDKLFLEIPRGPRGIDFAFLDPRGMEFCLSLIPRFLEEWNSPRNWHPYVTPTKMFNLQMHIHNKRLAKKSSKNLQNCEFIDYQPMISIKWKALKS